MIVRMISLAAGPRGVWRPGDEIEVSAEEGLALVQAKAAVPVRVEPERAVIEPAETRGPRRGRSGKHV